MTIQKQAKVQMVADAVRNTNGRFFTVTFTKGDGSERVMNCRTNVKKHLAGGDKTYDARDAQDGDVTIGVYEQQTEGYRCFKASRVKSLKIDGNTIKFS